MILLDTIWFLCSLALGSTNPKAPHGNTEVAVVQTPFILTNLHILNQDWIHVNGLGPWTDSLDMSAPESSETFGSRVSIDIDGINGKATMTHMGSAFIGIFRAGDLSVDMVYPPQNIFCSQENRLPTEENFDISVDVLENDIVFAVIPSIAEWKGIKPVDLQGSMYSVEAGDPVAFHDFVKNLPRIMKNFDATLLVASVSRLPKGLCQPYRVMHSRGHKDWFLQIEADEEFGFFADRSRVSQPAPRLVAPGIFLFGQDSLEPARTRQFRDVRVRSRSRSNSRDDIFRLDLPHHSSSSSSSSSSDHSAGDYDLRPNRSDSSSASPSFVDPPFEIGTPEQNQEADLQLNRLPHSRNWLERPSRRTAESISVGHSSSSESIPAHNRAVGPRPLLPAVRRITSNTLATHHDVHIENVDRNLRRGREEADGPVQDESSRKRRRRS